MNEMSSKSEKYKEEIENFLLSKYGDRKLSEAKDTPSSSVDKKLPK
jgi:hypothetical protein